MIIIICSVGIKWSSATLRTPCTCTQKCCFLGDYAAISRPSQWSRVISLGTVAWATCANYFHFVILGFVYDLYIITSIIHLSAHRRKLSVRLLSSSLSVFKVQGFPAYEPPLFVRCIFLAYNETVFHSVTNDKMTLNDIHMPVSFESNNKGRKLWITTCIFLWTEFI